MHCRSRSDSVLRGQLMTTIELVILVVRSIAPLPAIAGPARISKSAVAPINLKFNIIHSLVTGRTIGDRICCEQIPHCDRTLPCVDLCAADIGMQFFPAPLNFTLEKRLFFQASVIDLADRMRSSAPNRYQGIRGTYLGIIGEHRPTSSHGQREARGSRRNCLLRRRLRRLWMRNGQIHDFSEQKRR